MSSPSTNRFVSPDPGRPLIIAHRGGSLEGPENTLAALRRAVRLGADWQEVDVTLSLDGYPIIIHDDDVDRTTDGTGPVAMHTLEELRRLQAGRPRWYPSGMANLKEAGVKRPRKFRSKFLDERLPLLDEVLALPGMQMMLELKKVDRPDRLVDVTLSTIRSMGVRDRVGIASFEFDLLQKVNTRDRDMPLIGLCEYPKDRAVIATLPLTVLATWTKDVVAAKASLKPGVALWTWTSSHPDVADAQWLAGVDGVITDAPRRVMRHQWPPRALAPTTEASAKASPFGRLR